LSQSTSQGGEPLEDLIEGDPTFETGERGPETEVDAIAEGDVVADLAVDVEAARVGEAAFVAVRRGREHQHDAAARDHVPVVLDAGGDVARLYR
jgi:hypothetical protein